jgi:DNA-binding GntR family transcriptional regulator
MTAMVIDRDGNAIGSGSGSGGQTVNEVVYHKLKDDILWGKFAPDERLRFDELRERYGVSFSSLREVLSRLIGDGLVEAESHKGARVAGVNPADFADLVAVRQIIEVNCLERAIARGDDRWEAEAVAAFHMYEIHLRTAKSDDPTSTRTRIERHNGFHTALMSACDSSRLLNLRSVLATQAERYLMLAYRTVTADDEDTLSDHERLLRAAIERRTSLACAILQDHISSAANRLLATLGASTTVPAGNADAARGGRKAIAA